MLPQFLNLDKLHGVFHPMKIFTCNDIHTLGQWIVQKGRWCRRRVEVMECNVQR